MPRIHVFPSWRQNPYLNMLYLGARSEGWSVDGTTNVDELAAAVNTLAAGDVLHIHWTSPILQSHTIREDAREALDRFRSMIDGARAAGIILIWTVHNAISHEAKFVDLEIELAALLTDASERIIQLNTQTRGAVAEFYELPTTKLVTLRHASYVGVYSEPPSQYEARRQLGVPVVPPAVGFVGQMRGYKGLPTLLAAVGSVSRRIGDISLLLAGKTDPPDIEQISKRIPQGVTAVRRHTFVPDGEIGTWFAAADVLVFPYERVLNSGSVLLSATFGRPCILPAAPHLIAEFGSEPWVSFFDPSDNPVWSLALAIEAAISKGAADRASARRYAAEYTTFNMAWDYLSILNDAADAVTRTRGAS